MNLPCTIELRSLRIELEGPSQQAITATIRIYPFNRITSQGCETHVRFLASPNLIKAIQADFDRGVELCLAQADS